VTLAKNGKKMLLQNIQQDIPKKKGQQTSNCVTKSGSTTKDKDHTQ